MCCSPSSARSIDTSAAGTLVAALETWLHEPRAKLSGQSETGKAIDYIRKRWTALTRFLTAGMSNNAAERRCAASRWGRDN
jgi:transposase